MQQSRRLKLQIFRWVVLVVVGVFLLPPLVAMVEFSTRGNAINAPRSLEGWTLIGQTPGLVKGIIVSLELAIITPVAMLVLLLPTMVWVRLRLPGLTRIVEFVCLLPLTVPAIALVVGLKPIYIWIEINVSPLTQVLAFAYLILILPYSFRTLDAGLAAMDLKTLSEAARPLGPASPPVTLRVLSPTIPTPILHPPS